MKEMGGTMTKPQHTPMKLKKYIDPVCWEPSHEKDGGLYKNKHKPDLHDPEFCSGCGMKVFEANTGTAQ